MPNKKRDGAAVEELNCVSTFLVAGTLVHRLIAVSKGRTDTFGNISSRTSETMMPLCITREAGWLVRRSGAWGAEKGLKEIKRRDPGAHAGDLMEW
jgi:fructose-1,6-bisphosphatase/inositol monophosphatase family enzyme